jgi:signal peptidase I
MPRAARGAIALALLIALVSGLSVRSGPIMLLGVSFAALVSAAGMLRRRAWSAYGFGGLLILGILAILFFAITGQNPGTIFQTLIGLILYAAIAVIFLVSGHSLARTGANQGSPIPWILMALLFSAPFVLFRPVTIASGDMQPALQIGDFLLVDRFAQFHPALGELVAFRYPHDPSQILVRRLIGLPGDHIRLANGILYRNGVELPEPTPGKDADLTVPPNKYFVLGDNRAQARDSRTWGLIDRSDVIGQPKYIYDSLAPDAADIKAAPAASGDENILEPAHPPVRRWERVLKGL